MKWIFRTLGVLTLVIGVLAAIMVGRASRDGRTRTIVASAPKIEVDTDAAASRLAGAVHIDPAPLLPFAARVHAPARHDRKATPLPPEALAVHAELRAHALQRTH